MEQQQFTLVFNIQKRLKEKKYNYYELARISFEPIHLIICFLKFFKTRINVIRSNLLDIILLIKSNEKNYR